MARSATLPMIEGTRCVPLVREPLSAAAATDLARTLKAIADQVLVDAGLLTRDKRGVWAYFTLVPAVLDSLADVLNTQPHES